MKKLIKNRFLRILVKSLLGLFLVLMVVILFIRSPWGQGIIVHRVVNYVSGKTGTEVSIDRLYLTFSGSLSLEGLYVEDQAGDTLVYSDKLIASVALIPLIKGDEVNVKSIDWSGFKANIYRKESQEKFNYDFLITAFATGPGSNPAPSEPPQGPDIKVGKIQLNDFDLSYDDASEGLKSEVKLGRLNLDIDELDMDNMRFGIRSLEVANSQINHIQNIANSSVPRAATVENDLSSALPFLSIDEFILTNVNLDYESAPDQTMARVRIGDFHLNLPLLNLTQRKIDLPNLSLNNSEVFLKQIPKTSSKADTLQSSKGTLFTWPDWQVTAEEISFKENQIEVITTDSISKNGVFNPDHLQFNDFTLELTDIALKPQELGLSLKEFSWLERSGFHLKSAAFDLNVTDDRLSLDNLIFASNESALEGKARLNYTGLTELINHPEVTLFDADLSKIQVGMRDAFYFNPELRSNQYLSLVAQNKVTGTLQTAGSLSDLQVPQINLKWGSSTAIDLTGSLKNLLDFENLTFDLQQFSASTRKSDILKLISEDVLGIALPQKLNITGNAKGGFDDLFGQLSLKTSDGIISIDGKFTDKASKAFNADLSVQELNLNKLLQNEQLDTLSFTAKISGNGTELSNLNAQLTSNFEKLRLNGYDFSNLDLAAEVKNGKGDLDLAFKDQHLDMGLNSLFELDSSASNIKTTLNVIGADLYELGLTAESIKTAFVLEADFTGNASAFDINAHIKDGLAVYEREAYPFGNFSLKAKVEDDTTSLHIDSNILETDIIADKAPELFVAALKRQIDFYLGKEEGLLTDPDDLTKIKMNMIVRQAPILSDVFLRGLEQMDSVAINLDFDEKTSHLDANFLAPSIRYLGSQMDSLKIDLTGGKKVFAFNLGWAELSSGPLAIDKTTFLGSIQDNTVTAQLKILDELETLVQINSETKLSGDSIQFHINPEGLIFNKKQWTILAQNQILLADQFVDINDFELSNNEQKVVLGNKFANQKNNHVGATFENFQLATISNLLNADEPLAKGVLRGDFIIENPYDNYGFLADLNVTDLSVLEASLGRLELHGESKDHENYDVNLSILGDDIDLALAGDYLATEIGPELTLSLSLKKLQMSLVEKFSQDNISQSKGSLSADVKVSGTPSEPKYNGTLGFDQVGFAINQLQTNLSITDEQLKVDNSGLYLDQFVITDGDNNDFSLDGKIRTDELENPSFDLSLKADNFRLINSTKKDSDLFYGQVKMDADLKIQGDLKIPKVRGNLKINEGSDLTFIVPESQLELKARDGVVLFVNRKNPGDILTRVDQSESTALAAALAGYDVETVLSVGENSTFNIVIDERTGDNLKISGIGDFSVGLEPNGRTSLSGKYQLSGGHFETNLYNLVKRKFEIAPGSSIAWTGNPYDAELDVRAIYNIRTSAAPLMALRTSSESEGIAGAYQERLPFEVYINVNGVLLKPSISFNLEMPEEERGALGGEIYSQVQQLNSQEEDLNKQVFSLLVLNRFFPGAGSDGSNGGPASIALDNVNKVLSGQLNNYSDKIFGKTGLEVGFDLNSNTVNQGNGAQNQTQLGISASKKLFNDRLTVQVGSEVDVGGSQSAAESTPIIGNVSVEYLLTQDRRLRLQGFSKNQYSGVIDGQLTVSGIALIFNREFNRFKELWARQVKEEVTKNEKPEEK